MVILCCLPAYESVWATYRQFNGYLPSYIYPVNLNAGDVVRGKISWPGADDLDLYLYAEGMDLLDPDIWEDREFSASINP